MLVNIIADGAWPELFTQYVEYKKNLGYLYQESRLKAVRALSRFLAERPLDDRVITCEIATDFTCPRQDEAPGTTAYRRGIVRQFALFCRWKGIDAWVLPKASGPRQHHQFTPRIISPQEMGQIIACADARGPSRSGPQTQPVYAMLTRLLWCCGLRIGEALNLKIGDVDLDDAVITIRQAKHNRTRLVPLSNSLVAHAHLYTKTIGLVQEDWQGWFFPSPRGGRYSRGAASQHIRGLMLEAGVTTSSGLAPRVHDVRHSFALACLSRLQSQGIDIRAALTLLATYMGHADIVSTEYYLRLDPSAWTTIASTMENAYADVFPQAVN